MQVSDSRHSAYKGKFAYPLIAHEPYVPAEFRTSGVWDQLNTTLPHQMCDTVHDLDESEILARSELEVILIIMKAKFRIPSFSKHSHVPVRKPLKKGRTQLMPAFRYLWCLTLASDMLVSFKLM